MTDSIEVSRSFCRTTSQGFQAGKDFRWQESGQTALALRPGVAQRPRILLVRLLEDHWRGMMCELPTCQNPPGQCSNHSPSLYPLSSQLTRETGGAGVLLVTARRVMMQHEPSFSESKRPCCLAAWQKEEGEDGREQVGSTKPTAYLRCRCDRGRKVLLGGLASLDQPFCVLHQPQKVWHKITKCEGGDRAGEARSGHFPPAAAAIIKTRKSWGSAFSDACIQSPPKDS